METAANPSFKVKAVGSFKQLPGCPDYVKDTLEARRLLKMSLGECYNPSDERYTIDRIEVVRIRPQDYEGEPVENLIENTWLAHQCAPGQSGTPRLVVTYFCGLSAAVIRRGPCFFV